MLTLGIDLSASPKKGSSCAFMNSDSTLCHLGSFKETDELFQTMEQERPTLIAIDAPLFLPLGLHCLEEDCDCVPANGKKGRVAEQKLASMGIGCFFTAKRSIIRNLIYRAIEFRSDLEDRGYQVIEVYSYATKVRLFGSQVPAKNNPASLPFLKEKLATLIQGLDPYINSLSHDRCDALLSAYTGYLHLSQCTENLGQPEEGFITLPKLPGG